MQIPIILRQIALMKTTTHRKITENLTKIIFFVLLIFFIFRGIELASSIIVSISPDEGEHIKISQLYEGEGLFIEDTDETYKHGVLSRNPFLYYSLMGTALKYNILEINTVTLLRIINLFFSVITVIYVYRIAGLVDKSRLTRLLALVIATNTSMFTFLSSSVSYDNLTNMFASISIFYLILFYKKVELKYFVFLTIATSLGLITKVTFAPLAVIIVIITLWIICRYLWSIRGELDKVPSRIKPIHIIISALIIPPTLLVMNLYFVNIYKYSRLLPTCEQVLEIDKCRLNPTYTRDEELINDRPEVYILDPFHYLDPWGENMIRTIIGINGHERLMKSEQHVIPYEILLIIAGVSIIRIVSPRKKKVMILLVITLFYSLFLAYFQNYATYKNLGLIYVALQGRYLFPIFAPMCVLISYGLINISRNQYLRYTIFVVVSILFVFGDYFYFKRNVPKSWYFETPIAEEIWETNEYFK